jgi:hypothetical protein
VWLRSEATFTQAFSGAQESRDEKTYPTKKRNYDRALPPELHDEIKQAAAEAGHSMNIEITNRLIDQANNTTLRDITRQNMRTQEMIQRLIDTLC